MGRQQAAAVAKAMAMGPTEASVAPDYTTPLPGAEAPVQASPQEAPVGILPAPRPHALELISGLIRASIEEPTQHDGRGEAEGAGGEGMSEEGEITAMRAELENLKRERASLPLYLRGRLPPPPAKAKPKFLGDYGQRPGGNPGGYSANRPKGGKAGHSVSQGGGRVIGSIQRLMGGHLSRPHTDASLVVIAEDELATTGSEVKKLGASEDKAPKGQAHAGEEGRAVAARAVLLSVRPTIEEEREDPPPFMAAPSVAGVVGNDDVLQA